MNWWKRINVFINEWCVCVCVQVCAVQVCVNACVWILRMHTLASLVCVRICVFLHAHTRFVHVCVVACAHSLRSCAHRMHYWIVKSEPGNWSIDDHERKHVEHWDGVRNYQANNNMKKMKVGDLACMYHSVSDREIVGILKVVREHYPDHTDSSGKFGMVDFEFVKHVNKRVHLEEFKKNPKLQNTALVKQGRLSVIPINDIEWNEIMHQAQEETSKKRSKHT